MPGGRSRAELERAQAEREKKFVKKKKVVKKKPPVPVPSLTIAHETKPKAKPGYVYMGRDKDRPKPRPHGGHLPTQYEYLSPSDYLNRTLGVDTPEEKQRSRERNQWREQKRREENRAARAEERAAQQARRAAVRQIPQRARDMIGRDRIQDFIRTGRLTQDPSLGDYAGSLAKAAGRGVANKLGDLGAWAEGVPGDIKGYGEDLAASVVYGDAKGGKQGTAGRIASNRAVQIGSVAGRPLQKTLDPIGEGVGDVVFGPNIMKALSGEDYDGRMLGLELSLMFVPVKGLPIPITSLLRGLVGSRRFVQGVRSGETVADMIKATKHLNTPVASRRAARRMEIRRAAREAGTDVPMASSWAAGKLAGQRMDPVSKFIRNDPRTKRKFRMGDAEETLDADLSRTWKFFIRPTLDAARRHTATRVPLRAATAGVYKNESSMFLKAMSERIRLQSIRHQAQVHALTKAGNVPDVAMYAARAVLRDVPVSKMVNELRASHAEAAARGEWLEARALQDQIMYMEGAEKYTTLDTGGNVVLHPDAPASFQRLVNEVSNASGTREGILERLDVLSRERADIRLLNEQLMWHGARLQPADDFSRKAYQQNEVYNDIVKSLGKFSDEEAEYTLTLVEAMARRHWEEKRAMMLGRAKELKAEGRNGTARVLEEQAHTLEADDFFNHIDAVSEVVPPEVADNLRASYGSINPSYDDVVDAQSIADDIIESGRALPPELDTLEKLTAGIEEVFALARAGEHGKDWYKTAASVVKTISEAKGIPQKQVAQLVAIFSQAADTVSNVTFVFDAIRQWQTYGDVFTGRFPGRQGDEALAVLRGEGYEGRKRNSFYANILRHIPGMEDEYAATIKEMAELRGAPIEHPVTVDRWVVRMFRPDAKKDVPEKYYDTFETIMQKMAQRAGLEPEQIQAAAWVAKKQADLDKSLEKGGRRTVRHVAGGGDAFEHGTKKQLAQEAEGTAKVVTPQAKRLANQANKKWGGFTVGDDLKPVPEEGYSVSYSLTEQSFKLHGLKGEHIEQFRNDYANLLKDKRNHIGGFSDDANETGDAALDTRLSVTRHFKTKAAALKFAREQGQETVYEYKTGDGIRTGLTRDEQADIISKLDPASTKGGPPSNVRRLTEIEQTRDDFFSKAATAFGSKGKRPTDLQKENAERWFQDHAHEYPDEQLVKEYEALPQPKAQEDPFWMHEDGAAGAVRAEVDSLLASVEPRKGTLRGAWDPENRKLYLPPESHPSTYVHELTHAAVSEGLLPAHVMNGILEHVGAAPGAERLTTEQAEDVVDIVLAAFVSVHEGAPSSLPPQIKAAFEAMGKSIRSRGGSANKRVNSILSTLPEHLRANVEDAFWYKGTPEQNRFLGAKDIKRGDRRPVYTPDVPGLPFSFLSPKRAGVLWTRLRNGQRVTNLTPQDEHLTHQYTGALSRSGKWDKSVVKGPLEGLLKAVEMERMADIRDALIPAARDIPESAGDIAILMNPEEWVPETRTEVRRALALFHEMNPSKKITEQQLYAVDARGIDEAKLTLFPNIAASDDKAKIWSDIAQEVSRSQKPIPGVKWVSRSELEKAGVPGVPRVSVGDSVWGKRALNSFDFLNNYAKLMTLSLNPAYYPMNMAGQAVMGAVQQGAFLPYSLLRSMTIAHDLGDAVNLIDIYSGSGLASVVRGRGYGAGFTDAAAEVSRFLIDKYPRRAAFLYEARRLGYKTNAEVLDLLQNPSDDLITIASRANAAMVDFGHLSRLEREWITRIIFVYPWLKGSAKWTGQFVADHPFQAALLAGLIWWQQDRLHSALPDGNPGYLKWFFPLNIPEDGSTPYGFRMEQMFTPMQPLDLVADAAYWFGLDTPWGSNEEGMASKLNPLLEEIAKTIMGYDPFTKEQVSHNLLNLLRRMAPDERWASMKRVMKIVHRQEHEGIYDTTQFQNWLRLTFGGLAPINVDPEIAGDMSKPKRTITIPDVPPEERMQDALEEAEVLGGPIPPEKREEVEEMWRTGQLYDEAESEYKQEHDIESGLTPQRRLAVLILTYIKLHPESEAKMRPKMEKVLSLSDDEAEAEIEIGREKLGLTRLDSIKSKLSDLRTKAEEASRG